MIDLLYLAYNRMEFTRRSFETMLQNTDWTWVSRLVVYDDGSTDGTGTYLKEAIKDLPAAEIRNTQRLGPVGIMNDFIPRPGSASFAKIDNDVMLPPGWLNEAMQVYLNNPVDLLGIEAMHLGDLDGAGERGIAEAEYIGGIGIMRRSAFSTLPVPTGQSGRFGFTDWQIAHPEVKKAWIVPPLQVCLLNLVPFEPWKGLSEQYIAKHWQRDWPGPYAENTSKLWEWWV